MKTYKVAITETLRMEVEVMAGNAAQARELVERNWKNSDYVLDADHFQDVTFTTLKNRDYER